MKKKVLLSSILTIALCLCLIAGSTFALFTSQAQIDITVKAAKVEMTANIANLQLYSVKANSNGSIVDEFGGTYEYVKRNDTFANGGTATFENATLTLDRITPGDKVSFDIEGINTSDVSVQYRYVIECVDGQKLMSGLLVTVEGDTFEFLGTYTSGWTTLAPGNNMDPASVVFEFPVTAGNEYQDLTTEIKVTVEAVQGNADVAGSNLPIIKFLDNVAVDLHDRTIANVGVMNTTSLDLSNGTLAIDEVGFENYGKATLNNVFIDGGTPGTIAYGYAIISNTDSETILNDVTVMSANGGIAAVNGGQLTMNSGYVDVNSANTSGRYLIYVEGEGSTATINGGTFYFNKTQNQKRAYAYVGAGSTLIINGGDFGTASSRSGYTAGLLGDGEIIIKGGTFGFNPSKWVADGYKAEKVGAKWYVVPENVDVIVSNQAQLQAALDSATGDYVINVIGDIVGDVTVTQKADVNVTVLGNGHKFAGVLTVDGKSATLLSAGLTVKNFVFEADSISADACIRLGNGSTATRYCCNVSVIGCTFNVPGAVGVKSYTGGDKNISIIDCVATADLHSLAQLKGVDGVLVEGCTVNAVRGINFNNSDNVKVIGSTFDVEKYALRFGESGNSVVENYEITDCTLTSACDDGDAVIVLRAGATNANLTLTNTELNGAIEMTGAENANVTIQ